MTQGALYKASSILSKKDVILEKDSGKRHKHQGFMSEVFLFDSNKGKIIIQKSKLPKEHRQNKVWQKFEALSKLLAKHKEIPTSEILLCELIGDEIVIAQTFLPGIQAGHRILRNTQIIDEWAVNKKTTVEKILRELAKVHTITLTSFGWQGIGQAKNATVYKTWRDFLETESAKWVSEITKFDRQISKSKLKPIADQAINAANYQGLPVLVHGDAINPGNILINKECVDLLDWEWSIAADPAWEFCDVSWKPYRSKSGLTTYFEELDIEAPQQDDFLKRINAYSPAWLLWGAYMHAEDSDKAIYRALKALLLQAAKKV